MGCYIGQQGQVSRPLDGYRQSPLVPGTNTGLAPWRNLPSVGNELLQLRCVLIVDCFSLGDAE